MVPPYAQRAMFTACHAHSMPCSQQGHALWPRKVGEQQLAQWTPDQERGDVVVGAVVADTAM